MAKPPLNTNLVVMPCGCPCSVGVDPCNCNKASVGVQCRSRSGSYSLCGFEEFTNPSVPPKRYRQLVGTGTFEFIQYGYQWGCDNVFGYVLNRYTNSGAAIYANAPGCALVDTRQYVSLTEAYDHTTGIVTTSSATNHGSYIGTPYSTCNGEVTITRTSKRHQGAGTCCPNENGLARKSTGTVSETLSAEDTESDAIARAARSVAWSDWRSVSGGNACCASRSLRGAGQFAGAWTEAEIKLTAKGAPYAQAVVEVTFTQRPLGGGAASTSKEEYTVYCGGDGTGETTISVPTAAGSEVCFSGFKQLK